jgi:hypothetical protein
MPLDAISGAGRTASREAGVMPASFASLKAPLEIAETARWGGRASPKSSAPVGCGQTSATRSLSNTKGRLWAAEVENTAEDINSSGKFQGARSWEDPQAFSLFIRLLELCA